MPEPVQAPTTTPVEPPYVPDLTTVPNFDALRGWVRKLESWCDSAHDELGARDDALRDALSEKDIALGGEKEAEDALEHVKEMVSDIDRGIRTFEELKEWLSE